jgi:hypothetical protein
MVGSALNRYLEAIASSNAIKSSLSKGTYKVQRANDEKEASESQPTSALRMTASLGSTTNRKNNKQNPSIGSKKQLLSLETDNDETDSVTSGENDSDSNKIYHRQPQHVQNQTHPSPSYSYPKNAKWRTEGKEKELYTQGENKPSGGKQIPPILVESTKRRDKKMHCVCNDTKNRIRLTKETFARGTTNQRMNSSRNSNVENRKLEEDDMSPLKCTHCGHDIVVAPTAEISNAIPLSSPPSSSSNVHSIAHNVSPGKSYKSSGAALATTTREAATQTKATATTKAMAMANSLDFSLPKQNQTPSSPNPKIPDTATSSSPWRKLQSATTNNVKYEILSSSNTANLAADSDQDRFHYTITGPHSPKSPLNNNNNNYGTRQSRHTTPVKSWPLTMYSSVTNHAQGHVPTSDNKGKVAEPTEKIAASTDPKQINYLDPNGTSNLHHQSNDDDNDMHFISVKERKLQLWGSGPKESLRAWEHKKISLHQQHNSAITATAGGLNTRFDAGTISNSNCDWATAIESTCAPSSTHQQNNVCSIPASPEIKECNTTNYKIAPRPFKSQSSRFQKEQQQLLNSNRNDADNTNYDASMRISPEKYSKLPADTQNNDTNSTYHLRNIFQKHQEAIRVSQKANPLGSSKAAVVSPDNKISKGHTNLSSKGDFTGTSAASTLPTVSLKSNCNKVASAAIALVTPENGLSKNFFSTGNHLSGIRRNVELKKWDDNFHQHRIVKQHSPVPNKDANSKLDTSIPDRKAKEITSFTKIPINSSLAFNSGEQIIYPNALTEGAIPLKEDFSHKVKEENQKETHVNSPITHRPSVRDRVRALHLKVNSSNNGTTPAKGMSENQQSKNHTRNNSITSSLPQLSLQTINSGRQMCVSPLSSVDASCSSFWEDEMDDADEDVTSSDEETVSTLTNPTFTGSMTSCQKTMSNSSVVNDERKHDENNDSPTLTSEKGDKKLMNVLPTKDIRKIRLSSEGARVEHPFPTGTLPSLYKQNFHQISNRAYLSNLRSPSSASQMQNTEVVRNSGATRHNIKEKVLVTEGVKTHKDRSIFSLDKQLRPPLHNHVSNCNDNTVHGNLRLEYLNKLGRTMELAADFKKRYRVWEKNKDKTSSEIPFFMKRRMQEANMVQKHAVDGCQSTGRSYEKKHAICPVKAPMRPMPVTAAALSSPLPPLHPSQKFLGTTEGHRRTSESFSRIIERFSQNPNTKRVTNPTKGIRIVSGEI